MPTVIDLSTLTAAQGFVIQGDSPFDRAGFSVAGLGDINNDGFDDVIVGAPYDSRPSNLFGFGNFHGSAYVVYGISNPTRPTVDLTDLAPNQGFTVIGELSVIGALSEGRLGWSVSGGGDVNDDGIRDIMIGARTAGPSDSGSAYVIFGETGQTRTDIFLNGISSEDGFSIRGGSTTAQLGLSVAIARDINGDAIDDIVVGAPGPGFVSADGATYVIYGAAASSTVQVDSLFSTRGYTILGAGNSVAGAGDINGDGTGDIVIGYRNTPGSNGDVNAIFVVYGATGDTRTTIDLANLGNTDGFLIQNDAAGDMAGRSVSGAGDVNGDGIDDLIIGAFLGDNGGTDAGEAYIVYGKTGAVRTTVNLANLAASDGFVIQGTASPDDSSDIDKAGFSVSKAGDVNGDGIDDIIVGAPTAGFNRGLVSQSLPGAAYVVFGQLGTNRQVVDLANFTASDGFIIRGDVGINNITPPIPGDEAGFSVSAAGDVNNDGFDDLIVGAPNADVGGENAGAAYVVYGSANIAGNTAGNDVFLNGRSSESFDGLAGFDHLNMASFVNPITLDTVAGTVTSIDGGNDTVTNIEFFTLGGGNDFATLGDSGFVVRGAEGNDQVTGGTGRDLISGGDGDDILAGGTGAANELGGGDGNDIYIVSVRGDSTIEAVGGGFDEVRTALGVYQLQANIEALTFTDNAAHGAGIGNALDNAITGGTGRDDLFGRDGNDTLTGGTGAANTLVGGAGDDLYVVSVMGDSIIEAAGEGTDEVVTALNIFTLRDNVEILTFTGTGAFTGIGSNTDNLLCGGESNDFLSGRGGNDRIYGGGGDDILIGGAGADEFAMSFTGTPGVDRILDFTSGTDKLSFDNRIVDQSENFILVQGAGVQPTTFDASFIYNSTNGRLSYDRDGAGASEAVLYAILNPGLTLAVGDFIIY